jgi:hypothetical protein
MAWSERHHHRKRGEGHVTTLPAKAGNFWHQPEASALTGASRATHRAPPHVSARRLDPSPRSEPCRPSEEGAASPLVVLPSRGEGVNAISTAEHPKEPKLLRTRDMSYPRAFLVEPPEHTVRVKVPGSLSHKRLTCAFFSLPWMQMSRAPGGARAYGIRIPLRHKCRSPLRRFSMDATDVRAAAEQ